MSKTVRTFIAIKLNEDLQNTISNVQKKLRSLDVKVSWVKPENAHLTLKFLGDVCTEKIDKIAAVIKTACENYPAVELRAEGVGVFPNERHPKVLWLGLAGDVDTLEQLVDSIDTGLLKLHFHKDQKKFIPHITIGRVRSSKNVRQLVSELQKITIPEGLTLKAESITLFQSTLTPQGSAYKPLAESQLE